MTLIDEDGNIIEREKMNATISSAPDGNSKLTASGNAHLGKVATSHDSNSSFLTTKIQHMT